MRPLTPYAGGSGQVAPVISEIIRREGYKTYAEPLVGSGAVFFWLMPRRAFLGDLLWYNANMLICVRDDPERVIAELRELEATRDRFLAIQEEILWIENEYRSAAIWYYLLVLCYNGTVKVERVEYAERMKPTMTWGDRYLTWKERLPGRAQRIRAASRVLHGATVFCADYSMVLQADIAFFDPPYVGSMQDYGVDFDHQRLADYLKDYGGKWLLTINECTEAEKVYLPIAEWRTSLSPYYHVAPTAGGRGPRAELLLTNFKPKMFGG